jgi:hypothetical protein
MDKWRRFLRLPPDQRATVLRAAVLFLLTQAGLRVMGFQRWKELIERLFVPDRPYKHLEPAAQFDTAKRIVRAVRSVELHGPVTSNCLVRSMVLWFLLRRAGIDGELHIGARKKGSQLQAHAWVELGGQVLNDSIEVHQHYARFDAPIAAAETDSHAVGEAAPH